MKDSTTSNASEFALEPLYLPLPRELLVVSSFLAVPDVARSAKAVLELALGGGNGAVEGLAEPQAYLHPVQNIGAACGPSHYLTEKQIAYDNYFGVKRSAGNPAAVLCDAVLRTYRLLVIESEHGHSLNATELGHLAAGTDTVLQLLAGQLNSESEAKQK